MTALSFNRRIGLTLLIAVSCVVFFLADVATPIYFDAPLPALLILGVVTAQLTVICVWGTLVRGTFWIRLPWTLLLLMLSWCAFAWGITINDGSANTEVLLGIALIWMLGFVTSFVPLKIAAMCFRWQIVQGPADHHDARQDFRYAIRDIMIGTLLLALSMGIVRAMLPHEEISLEGVLQSSGLMKGEASILIAVFGVVSLLVKLPCIWISLGEKADKIIPRIGVWAVYCLVLAILEIGLLIALAGSPGPQAIEVVAGMILSHQVMGAITLAVCLALRGLGYRLERSVDDHGKHELEPESRPRPTSESA